MTYRLSILRRANDDADRIFNWLRRRSPVGAVSWYEAFLNTLTALARNPDNCGPADETNLADIGIRQRFFKTRRGRNYRVLFMVSGQYVRVLRVRAPGQRPVRPDQFRP